MIRIPTSSGAWHIRRVPNSVGYAQADSVGVLGKIFRHKDFRLRLFNTSGGYASALFNFESTFCMGDYQSVWTFPWVHDLRPTPQIVRGPHLSYVGNCPHVVEVSSRRRKPILCVVKAKTHIFCFLNWREFAPRKHIWFISESRRCISAPVAFCTKRELHNSCRKLSRCLPLHQMSRRKLSTSPKKKIRAHFLPSNEGHMKAQLENISQYAGRRIFDCLRSPNRPKELFEFAYRLEYNNPTEPNIIPASSSQIFPTLEQLRSRLAIPFFPGALSIPSKSIFARRMQTFPPPITTQMEIQADYHFRRGGIKDAAFDNLSFLLTSSRRDPARFTKVAYCWSIECYPY